MVWTASARYNLIFYFSLLYIFISHMLKWFDIAMVAFFLFHQNTFWIEDSGVLSFINANANTLVLRPRSPKDRENGGSQGKRSPHHHHQQLSTNKATVKHLIPLQPLKKHRSHLSRNQQHLTSLLAQPKAEIPLFLLIHPKQHRLNLRSRPAFLLPPPLQWPFQWTYRGGTGCCYLQTCTHGCQRIT